MTDFTTHTVDTAPEGAKPVLDAAQRALGFIPNLYATMATAPALLKGYTTLAGIFDTTSFTPTERQVVLMTNNLLNDCRYCMAAHTTISQGQGVAADVLAALRDDAPIADDKLEALRQFTKVVNQSRGWPADGDIQAFLAAGYTQANILEVILGTSLKVMSNYTNHVAETEVDAAFAPNRWEPETAKAA